MSLIMWIAPKDSRGPQRSGITGTFKRERIVWNDSKPWTRATRMPTEDHAGSLQLRCSQIVSSRRRVRATKLLPKIERYPTNLLVIVFVVLSIVRLPTPDN